MAAGYTDDTGMLIAGERDDRDAWALHRRALAMGVEVRVPAAVLAQARRGGPQPVLSRFLKGADIVPMSQSVARSLGG